MMSRRPPGQRQENGTRRSTSDRKRRTRRKRPKASSGCSLSFLLVAAFIAFTVLTIFLWLSVATAVLRKNVTLEVDSAGRSSGGGLRGAAAQRRSNEQSATNNNDATVNEALELRKRHDERKAARKNESGIRAASIDQIVENLMGMARMPTKDLRAMLEGSSPSLADPFHLPELRKGQCPWSGDDLIEWLPERPLLQSSEWFRQDNGNANGDNASKHRAFTTRS